MTDARDETGRLMADDRRLTLFGLSLRSTSLDELPELLNVLRAPLSLMPIVEFGIGEDARCETILNRAQPAQPGPRPAAAPRAATPRRR